MTYFVDAISGDNGAQGSSIHIGKFQKLEDAVRAAEQTVNGFLETECTKDMTPETLLACYRERGLHPFIFVDDDDKTFNVRSFNHFQYARKRCSELCNGTGSA